MKNFDHVEDTLLRSVLNGDLSEDAVCYAIDLTLRCAHEDQANEDVPFSVSAQRLAAALDAEEWWNDHGDVFEALESLRAAWGV